MLSSWVLHQAALGDLVVAGTWGQAYLQKSITTFILSIYMVNVWNKHMWFYVISFPVVKCSTFEFHPEVLTICYPVNEGNQSHSYWSPGNARNQGISRYDIYLLVWSKLIFTIFTYWLFLPFWWETQAMWCRDPFGEGTLHSGFPVLVSKF